MLVNLNDKLTADDIRFISAMADGLVSSRSKYPGPGRRLAGLYGEFGEVMCELQQLESLRAKDTENLGRELRQAAQMCCRLAVEGDLSFHDMYSFPTIVPPTGLSRPHHADYTGV